MPRGGKREGAGRGPVSPFGVAEVTATVRITQVERERFRALGGSAWLRFKIAEAWDEREAAESAKAAKVAKVLAKVKSQ